MPGLRGVLGVGLILVLSGGAFGDDPTKSPRYAEFRDAKIVVVARLDAARVVAVLESFPPQYQFEVKLTPGEVLRGDLAKGKQLGVRHSITSVNEPKLPVGMEVLVQLLPIRDTHRIVKLETPTKELLAVARAATTSGKAQQDREEELSRKDPTKHPRFQGFSSAPGIAIIAADDEGTVSFDAQTMLTTMDLKAMEVLRGELRKGAAFRGTFPARGAPGGLTTPTTRSWLATYRIEGGVVRLLSLDEPTEALLRVVRAAVPKK